MNEVKPGLKTTEFWLTILNAVFMALVGFGAIGEVEANEFKDLAAPLVAAVLPIVVYVWGRAQVKK